MMRDFDAAVKRYDRDPSGPYGNPAHTLRRCDDYQMGFRDDTINDKWSVWPCMLCWSASRKGNKTNVVSLG